MQAVLQYHVKVTLAAVLLHAGAVMRTVLVLHYC
jgi:hypothetical protein